MDKPFVRRRIVGAFPWMLLLAASTSVGSCCVLCIPIPHPGDAAPAPVAAATPRVDRR